MPVAVLADIHGNLPALDAVLADVDAAGADAIVLNGDVAINERQVIVGSVDDRPALWRTPASRPTMMVIPGPGWSGYAAGIDEDGTVVGRLAGAADKPDVGYLWRPDGGPEKLPVPTVRGRAATTYTADAIRNGWVAGWARLDEGDIGYVSAPLWNVRSGEVETTGGRVFAQAVNRHGWTVGDDKLVAGDRVVDLPGLGENPLPGSADVIAYSVSDDGSTVAGQADRGGQPVAVVWKCR